MYYQDILNILRLAAVPMTPSGVRHQLELNLPVYEPRIADATVCEELDYLLMARLVAGNDIEGYGLSLRWHELSDLDLSTWLFGLNPDLIRPALENPAEIHRRWNTPYRWEADFVFSFQFAVCQDVGDGDTVVAIVSGMAKDRTLLDNQSIRDRVSEALTAWYRTPEGLAAWEYAAEDFNVGDLAGVYSESLTKLLWEISGIRDLHILTASGDVWWTHDNILGCPPAK